MTRSQTSLLAGAFFGGAGVILGAWGAHGLAAFLGTEDTGAWDTAVLYQLVHALALLGLAALPQSRPARALAAAGWLFAIGIVLFSGSLYALVLGAPGALGPLTPVGGLFLVAGWVALALGALQSS